MAPEGVIEGAPPFIFVAVAGARVWRVRHDHCEACTRSSDPDHEKPRSGGDDNKVVALHPELVALLGDQVHPYPQFHPQILSLGAGGNSE